MMTGIAVLFFTVMQQKKLLTLDKIKKQPSLFDDFMRTLAKLANISISLGTTSMLIKVLIIFIFTAHFIARLYVTEINFKCWMVIDHDLTLSHSITAQVVRTWTEKEIRYLMIMI